MLFFINRSAAIASVGLLIRGACAATPAYPYFVYSTDNAVTYSPASSWDLLQVTGSTECGSEFLLGARSNGVVTFTFPQPSTSFQWWGFQRSDGGLANVCIDCASGSTSGTHVSYYNASTNGSEAPRLLYTKTGLSNAVHTVTITNILDPSVNGYGQLTVDRFMLSGKPVAPSFPTGTFLTNVPMQATYHVPLTLGGHTPACEVLLDAGASGAWVVWKGCTESQCQGHNVYQPSTTHFYNFSVQDDLYYGNGGPANELGTWRVNDTLEFGTTTIPTTTFGAAFSLPGSEGLDGNFGVAKAYYVSSQCGKPTYSNFIENMYVEGIIKAPVLSFYQLNSNDAPASGVSSVAAIGGVDSDKFTGKIDWIPISPDSMWTNPSSSRYVTRSTGIATIDATATYSHPAITFDTGDPGLLGLPHDDWLVLMQQLQAQGPDSNGNYLLPCSSTMTWNFYGTQGANYTFNLADTTTNNGNGFCSPLANDAGDTTNWITGAPFLDTYYIAFHYSVNLMGFAKKNLAASAANSAPVIGSTA